MNTEHAGSLINILQVSLGAAVIVLAVVQIMWLKRNVPILRFSAYAAFVFMVGGVALGKYYANTAPKRLEAIESSNPSKAIAGYSDAIRLSPSDSKLYFGRGRTDLHLRRYADAISDFTKALELSPDNPKYLADRAFAFLFIGDIESAGRDINRSIKGGYRDPEALMGQALISKRLGRYDDAIEQYKEALSSGKLDPENRCFSLIDRSIAYEQKGEYTKALEDLNEVNCESEREIIFVNRANIYKFMNQGGLALLDWEMALKLDPNDPVVFKNRGAYFFDQGQLDRGLSDFNRYVVLRPNDPYGYTIRSEIHMKMGETTAAQADLNYASELYKTNRARLYPSIPGGMMTEFGKLPTT